jgi:hypothetical protein
MKNLLVFLGILGMGINVNAQKLKPVAKVESVKQINFFIRRWY